MTSEVKRCGRFLTSRVMDLRRDQDDPARKAEGSQAPDLRSRIGEITCSTLRRSPTAMSQPGTNPTRPGAPAPSPRSGRRTRRAQTEGERRADMARFARLSKGRRKETAARAAFAIAPRPAPACEATF